MFFSHNKTASAGLSTAETISRTEQKMIEAGRKKIVL
jgi:hypothetical protein